MLMHSAVNQTNGVVPTRVPVAGSPFALDTSLSTFLTGVLLWTTAWYFLVRMSTTARRTGIHDPNETVLYSGRAV